MRVSYGKLRIKFHRSAIRVLCFAVDDAASLQRRSEPVPGNGHLWIELDRSAGEELSVCKSLSVISAGAWLDQHHTQCNIGIGFVGCPLNCITIRRFSIVPSLLV